MTTNDIQSPTDQRKLADSLSETIDHCLHLVDALPSLAEFNAVKLENDRLRAALAECEAYFADRADVVDGSYGVPAPNAEMQLLSELRPLLARARS